MSTMTSRTAPLTRVTYFCLAGRDGREVHAPDDSPAGHRAVGLRGLRPVPERLRQLRGPGPFQEVTPCTWACPARTGSNEPAGKTGRKLRSFTPNGRGACPHGTGSLLSCRKPRWVARARKIVAEPARARAPRRSRAAFPGLLHAPLSPYDLARPVRHALPAHRWPPARSCGAGPAVPRRSGRKNCSPGRPQRRGCG